MAEGEEARAAGEAGATTGEAPRASRRERLRAWATGGTLGATTASDLDAAQAGLAAARRESDAAVAGLRSAEASDARAQSERQRYGFLLARNAATREAYEDRLAGARTAAAAVQAARARVQSARRAIDQAQSHLAQAGSRKREAEANAPDTVSAERAAIAAREA